MNGNGKDYFESVYQVQERQLPNVFSYVDPTSKVSEASIQHGENLQTRKT